MQNIESALHITLNNYQHPTEPRTFFSPDREPTPDLGVRLWSIGGLDNYSTPKPMFTRRDPNTVTPEATKGNATIGSGPKQFFPGQRYARGLLRWNRTQRRWPVGRPV